MSKSTSRRKSIHLQCCAPILESCDKTAEYRNDTEARKAGWYFSERLGWICPDCNRENGTQTALPFALDAVTKKDWEELDNYFRQ